jgi:hypothetical protein
MEEHWIPLVIGVSFNVGYWVGLWVEKNWG